MLGRKGYSGGLAHRLVREMIAAEGRSGGQAWDTEPDDADVTGFVEDD